MISYFSQVFYSIDPVAICRLVTDTFTLVAGFVAIGIPLSMQAVERAAQRYKSEHLVEFFSTWRWVSPGRLIWLALGYVFLGLITRYFVPTDSAERILLFRDYVICWAVMVYFFFLFLGVGFWYSHLLSGLRKRPAQIIDELS